MPEPDIEGLLSVTGVAIVEEWTTVQFERDLSALDNQVCHLSVSFRAVRRIPKITSHGLSEAHLSRNADIITSSYRWRHIVGTFYFDFMMFRPKLARSKQS